MKTSTPDIDKKDMSGMTPLMHAAFHGDIELMKSLLAKGAQIEAQDRYGSTPLMWGAFFGHTQAVSLLLKHGACMDRRNAEGNAAQDIARKYRYEDVIEVFEQERERRAHQLHPIDDPLDTTGHDEPACHPHGS